MPFGLTTEKKMNETIESYGKKVESLLAARDIKPEAIADFMKELNGAEEPNEEPKATGNQIPEEEADGAKPKADEAGKGDPSDKKEPEQGQGNGENPNPQAQPVAPKVAEGGEKQPQAIGQADPNAIYEELRKTNEALAARLTQVEEALAKTATLANDEGAPKANEFGGAKKVAPGQEGSETDMGAILKDANSPRH